MSKKVGSFGQAHFLLLLHWRKEPGNIGRFKPFTSSAWILAAPIGLQNRITWRRGHLKAWKKSNKI